MSSNFREFVFNSFFTTKWRRKRSQTKLTIERAGVTCRLLIIAMLVTIAVPIVGAPTPASAGVPGVQQTCKVESSYGTVRALPGGRTMDLAMPRAGGYLPQTPKVTTRVFNARGEFLWTIDYRVEPSGKLTRLTFNRDRQVQRSGNIIVAYFWWDKVIGDLRCRAWSRVP